MRRSTRVWAGTSVVVCALGIAVPGARAGGVTDLGTLGGTSSTPTGISANGQVAGYSTTNVPDPASDDGPVTHAFSWTSAHGMVDLGVLPDASVDYSAAVGVSDSGLVAGNSYSADGERGFVWTQAGGIVDLGVVGGASSGSSVVAAVSAGGQVVGNSAGPGSGNHAFSWTQQGGMTDLGTGSAAAVSDDGIVAGSSARSGAFLWTAQGGRVELGLPPNTFFATPKAVNDGGRVVADAQTQQGYSRPYSWTADEGWVALDSGPVNGDMYVSALNDAGEAVGVDFDPTAGMHGFSWTPQGGVTPLSPLPGWARTSAADVNQDGLVVGFSSTDLSRATAWGPDGHPVDLGALPAGGSSAANMVNDSGVSAGTAGEHAVVFAAPDGDGDGVLDGSDNCPDDANPGQGDADFDGIGNACDPVDGVPGGRVLARGTVKRANGREVKLYATNFCGPRGFLQLNFPNGSIFKTTDPGTMRCFDSPAFTQSPASQAGFDVETGHAPGLLDGQHPASIDWTFIDRGRASGDKVQFTLHIDGAPDTVVNRQIPTAYDSRTPATVLMLAPQDPGTT
jgi:probable HAF family extracellular repeat protein